MFPGEHVQHPLQPGAPANAEVVRDVLAPHVRPYGGDELQGPTLPDTGLASQPEPAAVAAPHAPAAAPPVSIPAAEGTLLPPAPTLAAKPAAPKRPRAPRKRK